MQALFPLTVIDLFFLSNVFYRKCYLVDSDIQSNI